ncbi:diguanylate cyclase [Thermotalea metallivorans]|uniref:Cyclic di-GMP phosphodiesterase response regulator RpfG n=1 Tax=Thermotalea metallivorans TaxID=520762 RepID=A0A140L2A1_9FIRM|nr:diguanylate cyclase [Thermotalea metallivorans]KXG74676.1 Cyclic di-GMP phosphodiesterase response regulator RpfG [Thermotalea metallivorans]
MTEETLKEGVVYTEGIRYKKDKCPVNVLIRSVSIGKEGEVVGGYGIYTDITKIKKYEKKLEYLSIYDALTGVFNFNYFENKIREYKEKKDLQFGLIMCDLNGLKLINDTLGHTSGDEFLKIFADILKKSVRGNDIIARIGGDEFVVILPQVNNREEIKKIMERIKENIEKYNQAIQNKILRLSVALGCSIGDNKEIDKILKEADDAMYRNKLLTKESSKRQLLSVLMAMLSERDFVTSGHTQRVADLCKKIAQKIELDEDKKSKLVLLAEVHDLGKIAIPDHILKKPGKLTAEEWEIMKSHTEKGYPIALNSHELSDIADLILKHHERWDGKGYPLGLKEEKIPIECRILSLVDAYDAMMSKRPYNQPKSKEESIEELKRCAGIQFDPYLTEVLLNILYEEV